MCYKLLYRLYCCLSCYALWRARPHSSDIIKVHSYSVRSIINKLSPPHWRIWPLVPESDHKTSLRFTHLFPILFRKLCNVRLISITGINYSTSLDITKIYLSESYTTVNTWIDNTCIINVFYYPYVDNP